MTVQQVRETLDARVLSGAPAEGRELSCAISSDSMSDVLTFSISGCLLLTGLTNLQVVRTAEIADLAAICFIHGKLPGEDMTALAKEKNIVILGTELSMFEACGKLYQAGMNCPKAES